MPELKFNNNNGYFQKLVSEASNLIQENKLNDDGLKKLEKIASSDGTITKDERSFIDGLKNKVNVERVSRGDFDSKHFTFYSDKPQDRLNYKPSYSPYNPLNDEIHNIGEEKFNNIIADPNTKSKDLKSQILNSPPLKNDLFLSMSFRSLDSKFKDNREALMYINELFSRKPELSKTDLKRIADKSIEMLSTDYDSRITNNKELVMTALHDIAAPQHINQSNISTCTATAIQIQISLKSPLEYLNMLDTLAKNKPYKLVSGNVITPNWTFDNENKTGTRNSERTLSSKIMQNAIMDYGNGTNNSFDSSSKDDKSNVGLTQRQAHDTINSIFKSDLNLFNNSQYNQEQLADVIKMSKPSYSNPISASIYFDQLSKKDAVHMVDIVSVKDSKLTMINPWGREETIDINQMKGRIISVSADKNIDAKIEKFSSIETDNSDFKNNLVKMLNNSSQRDKTLYKLSNNDKLFNVLMIYNENIDGKPKVNPDDKKAVLYIIDNLLSGSDFNKQNNLNNLKNNLSIYGFSIPDILAGLKMDTILYNQVSTKLKAS